MYCLGTVYYPAQFGDIVVKAMVLQFYGKLIKKQDNNYSAGETMKKRNRKGTLQVDTLHWNEFIEV